MFERIKFTPNFILKKFFNYSEFREGQLEIINNILLKKNTLAILPTGEGKSICYQIPAFIFSQKYHGNAVSIIISPLISLMKDQVDSLNSKGISACYINSSLSKQQQWERFELIKLGKIKIIYVSPERLESKEFVNIIKKIKVAMIVVDEAHCISQWGDDFRPSYKKISNFYHHFNTNIVKVAFSATANKEVQNDICKTLKLNNPFIFYKSVFRKNLIVDIIKCESKTIKNLTLLRILNKHNKQAGIIYCSTKNTVENLSKFLLKFNIPNVFYHSEISKKEKNLIQNSFINGNSKLIIATNAFGMGIDKSNIRFVIHYQIPSNIENYYQEIGRAGRDSKSSNCYSLYYKNDIKIQKSFINKKTNTSKKKLKKLEQMLNFLNTKQCRNNFILKYFNEEAIRNCNTCDNCLRNKKTCFNSSSNSNFNYDDYKHNNNYKKHPLLNKISKKEIALIKKLVKQKYLYKNPTHLLTDKEICYLSILKPKNKKDCMNIPGLGKGWINQWWKIVSPVLKC